MAFDLSEDDDTVMCRYIKQVLQTYSSGAISLNVAEADIAYAMVAATVDDERAFKKYIRLSPEERARA